MHDSPKVIHGAFMYLASRLLAAFLAVAPLGVPSVSAEARGPSRLPRWNAGVRLSLAPNALRRLLKLLPLSLLFQLPLLAHFAAGAWWSTIASASCIGDHIQGDGSMPAKIFPNRKVIAKLLVGVQHTGALPL